MYQGKTVEEACGLATEYIDLDLNGYADKHESEAKDDEDYELKPHGLSAESCIVLGNRYLTIN